MENKMINKKSELVKVVETYVSKCIYDGRNSTDVVNELFGDFTCGQLESMVKLFDCVLHTDYFTKEITDTVTLNEAEVERMKRFIRCEQSKDRAKFVILNILDGTCYGFNHAMDILNGLKVENIKLDKLYSIFKLFVDAFNNYYKEEIEEKVIKENEIIFNEEVVKSMKDAVENNINTDDYDNTYVGFNFTDNSYKVCNSKNQNVEYLNENEYVIFTVGQLFNETEEEIVLSFKDELFKKLVYDKR